MEDRHIAVVLIALVLGCLVICGVVMPILNFLISGLWPHREVVSLVLLGLLIFTVVSGQARKTLKSLIELSQGLPDILDTVLSFMHSFQRFRSPDDQAPKNGYSSDASHEQGIPVQGYCGTSYEERRW